MHSPMLNSNTTPYNFIKLDELFLQSLEIEWVIEDIVPSNSIGMIYGPSGCGKSHIVLSMAAMIANGRNWFDNNTTQGDVLVLAGEGHRGLASRLKAIEKEHNLIIDRDKLRVSSRSIGLDTDSGYSQALQAIEALGTPPKVIFIDTLSRHLMESGENSNDDMARFINKLEDIRLTYGCTIILVHHTGKSTNNGARGASALKANVDFSFEVSGQNKKCSLSCDKMKDADDAIPPKYFEIKAVDLDQVSSKEKPITGACVVESTQTMSHKVTKQSKADLALACFSKDKKAWQQAYVQRCTDSISDESKGKQFREARKSLFSDGKVIENDDGSYSLNEAT